MVTLTSSSSEQLHEISSAAERAGFFFVKPTPRQSARLETLSLELKKTAHTHIFDQPLERKYMLSCGDMQVSRGWEMSTQHLALLRPCPPPDGWHEPSVTQGIVNERFCSGPVRDSYDDSFFHPTPPVTPEFDAVMQEMYQVMEELSLNLHGHLSSLLSLPISLENHCSNLQIANYPSQLEPKPVPRVKEHADSGTLTLLLREPTSEMQKVLISSFPCSHLFPRTKDPMSISQISQATDVTNNTRKPHA
eukprot:914588-Prorocentrum_minimum.AAC.4